MTDSTQCCFTSTFVFCGRFCVLIFWYVPTSKVQGASQKNKAKNGGVKGTALTYLLVCVGGPWKSCRKGAIETNRRRSDSAVLHRCFLGFVYPKEESNRGFFFRPLNSYHSVDSIPWGTLSGAMLWCSIVLWCYQTTCVGTDPQLKVDLVGSYKRLSLKHSGSLTVSCGETK